MRLNKLIHLAYMRIIIANLKNSMISVDQLDYRCRNYMKSIHDFMQFIYVSGARFLSEMFENMITMKNNMVLW